MEIRIERCKDAIDEPLSLEDFSVRHRLVMKVNERESVRPGEDGRFYASFEDVEVRTGSAGLLGEYGNGATPEKAIADYVNQIRGKYLIYGAYTPDRREFWAHIE